jgi:hypothetical protein
MTLKALSRFVTVLVCYSGLLLPLSARAVPYQFTLDTTALAGTTGQLALDVLDGGTPSNTVTLSGLATDGVLGATATLGSVSVAWPGTVTLTDGDFFNEWLTEFTFGTTCHSYSMRRPMRRTLGRFPMPSPYSCWTLIPGSRFSPPQIRRG